ncbi:hypothetical protein MNBD_GAMMA01-2251, partial [hydrothermal vent metagenome]
MVLAVCDFYQIVLIDLSYQKEYPIFAPNTGSIKLG